MTQQSYNNHQSSLHCKHATPLVRLRAKIRWHSLSCSVQCRRLGTNEKAVESQCRRPLLPPSPLFIYTHPQPGLALQTSSSSPMRPSPQPPTCKLYLAVTAFGRAARGGRQVGKNSPAAHSHNSMMGLMGTKAARSTTVPS